MPSRLVNLFRTLSWSDFPHVDHQAPAAGQTVEGAATQADISPSGFAMDSIPGTRSFRIRDSITVSIEFRRNSSWVANWVFDQSQSFQDSLLAHEQGHYNIAALIGRDFFLELMQLKANQYNSAAAAQADLTAVSARTAGKAQAAQDRYDADTANGTNTAQQTIWNAFITSAFTMPVSPARQAADGTPIKVPLLTVLSQAGINL